MRPVIRYIFIYLLLTGFACTLSYAQGTAVDARVASAKGKALRFDTGRLMFSIKAGDTLAPGDEIDTRAGGTVVIELSDGSLVLIQPGSRVVLKDYRTATSLRELLKIVVGRVRIKINHFGGKPNPYRVNSPTASIAVRGTEFSVFVDHTGSTEVRVHEGLVEVTNLNLPQQKVLVGKGHSVLVRPNEGIQFFSIRYSGFLNNQSNFRYMSDTRSVSFDVAIVGDVSASHSSFGGYVSRASENGLPARFTAFADLHTDSLENPAYASAFNRGEAQFSLVPTWSSSRNNLTKSISDVLAAPHDFDQSYFPRASLFIPVTSIGTVIGGSVEGATIDLRGGQDFLPQQDVSLTYGANTKSSFLRTSFMAARKFGNQGRTSLGISWNVVRGASLRNVAYSLYDDKMGRELSYQGESELRATTSQVKIGLKKEFAATHTVGLYYRYAAISGDTENIGEGKLETGGGVGTSATLTRRTRSGNLSEIGVSLRGYLTNRLFYGAKSFLTRFSLDEHGTYTGKSNDRTTDTGEFFDANQSTQAEARFGLGYYVRPQLVLSFDVAGGFTNSHLDRDAPQPLSVKPLQSQTRYAFFSLHGAVQANLWKNLFATASLYALQQTQSTKILLSAPTLTPTPYDFRLYKLSDFGIGWHFPYGLSPQYIISTDYGRTPINHSMLLRYTMAFGKR
jgi:hypothetical protein